MNRFADGKMTWKEAMDFAWEVSLCTCTCGDCPRMQMHCPLGFITISAMSLVLADPSVRLQQVQEQKWGCGLIVLREKYLGFLDILLSGWPLFRVIRLLANALSSSGITENVWLDMAGMEGSLTICSSEGWME